MCGITGVIGTQDFSKQKLLELIQHRGPDSQGWYEDDDIFLGHTRLAIQDLSDNGNQPFYSHDGRYVIIFNGEIYNHLDIRKDIENDYHFKSTCDTETLLYAYIKYGTDVLNKLNGIFAFAIYDIQEKEVFLARDQFGVKPLYFYQDDAQFLFSSELKSFTAFNIDTAVSLKALADYLTFLWAPWDATPFLKVKKLLPGCYFKYKVTEFAKAAPVSYYSISFTGQYSKKTEQELADELESKLIAAVERQMLSDVPVGFFLSGGLDSSLLVAIARKLYPDRELQCYTIDTGELGKTEGFANDLPYAKKVAEHLNVKLDVLKADFSILRDFHNMVWYLDEPQADLAPLNVMNICREARKQGVEVLLGGTAGDDIFSGYRRHQALSMERYVNKTPLALRKLAKGIAGLLPANISMFRRLQKLTSNIDKDATYRMASYFSWLPYNNVKKLFLEKYRPILDNYDPLDNLTELITHIPDEKSLLNQMLYLEINGFLVSHNLNYTDKLSMAVGVEVRVPYLDKDLVEFSTIIPPELKMKGGETKYLLKKVAEKYLPNDVIYRPKTGFGTPVRKWIMSDLDKIIGHLLSPQKLSESGIFEPTEVWKLIEDNKNGKIDASYAILSLLVIESWMRQFAYRSPQS